MKKCLVPVLLLALVTMSSSNVVPSFPDKQVDTDTLSLDRQQKDNIFSNKFINKHNLKYILCKEPMNVPDRYFVTKLCNTLRQSYAIRDNNELNREINVNRNYNDEGFRKEQWHNYPSQMDRLDLLLYQYRNEDQDTDGIEYNGYDNNDNGDPQILNTEDKTSNDLTNEKSYQSEYIPDYEESGMYSVIPRLILNLKVNSIRKLENKPNNLPENEKSDKKEDNLFTDDSSPILEATVAKREHENVPQDFRFTDDHSAKKTKMVKKRLFSLWSRLQSLSHRGHELQHRRHLYAYYGLPDADKSRILTAETRATLMRPPGSPLRWG